MKDNLPSTEKKVLSKSIIQMENYTKKGVLNKITEMDLFPSIMKMVNFPSKEHSDVIKKKEKGHSTTKMAQKDM